MHIFFRSHRLNPERETRLVHLMPPEVAPARRNGPPDERFTTILGQLEGKDTNALQTAIATLRTNTQPTPAQIEAAIVPLDTLLDAAGKEKLRQFTVPVKRMKLLFDLAAAKGWITVERRETPRLAIMNNLRGFDIERGVLTASNGYVPLEAVTSAILQSQNPREVEYGWGMLWKFVRERMRTILDTLGNQCPPPSVVEKRRELTQLLNALLTLSDKAFTTVGRPDVIPNRHVVSDLIHRVQSANTAGQVRAAFNGIDTVAENNTWFEEGEDLHIHAFFHTTGRLEKVYARRPGGGLRGHYRDHMTLQERGAGQRARVGIMGPDGAIRPADPVQVWGGPSRGPAAGPRSPEVAGNPNAAAVNILRQASDVRTAPDAALAWLRFTEGKGIPFFPIPQDQQMRNRVVSFYEEQARSGVATLTFPPFNPIDPRFSGTDLYNAYERALRGRIAAPVAPVAPATVPIAAPPPAVTPSPRPAAVPPAGPAVVPPAATGSTVEPPRAGPGLRPVVSPRPAPRMRTEYDERLDGIVLDPLFTGNVATLIALENGRTTDPEAANRLAKLNTLLATARQVEVNSAYASEDPTEDRTMDTIRLAMAEWNDLNALVTMYAADNQVVNGLEARRARAANVANAWAKFRLWRTLNSGVGSGSGLYRNMQYGNIEEEGKVLDELLGAPNLMAVLTGRARAIIDHRRSPDGLYADWVALHRGGTGYIPPLPSRLAEGPRPYTLVHDRNGRTPSAAEYAQYQAYNVGATRAGNFNKVPFPIPAGELARQVVVRSGSGNEYTFDLGRAGPNTLYGPEGIGVQLLPGTQTVDMYFNRPGNFDFYIVYASNGHSGRRVPAQGPATVWDGTAPAPRPPSDAPLTPAPAIPPAAPRTAPAEVSPEVAAALRVAQGEIADVSRVTPATLDAPTPDSFYVSVAAHGARYFVKATAGDKVQVQTVQWGGSDVRPTSPVLEAKPDDVAETILNDIRIRTAPAPAVAPAAAPVAPVAAPGGMPAAPAEAVPPATRARTAAMVDLATLIRDRAGEVDPRTITDNSFQFVTNAPPARYMVTAKDDGTTVDVLAMSWNGADVRDPAITGKRPNETAATIRADMIRRALPMLVPPLVFPGTPAGSAAPPEPAAPAPAPAPAVVPPAPAAEPPAAPAPAERAPLSAEALRNMGFVLTDTPGLIEETSATFNDRRDSAWVRRARELGLPINAKLRLQLGADGKATRAFLFQGRELDVTEKLPNTQRFLAAYRTAGSFAEDDARFVRERLRTTLHDEVKTEWTEELDSTDYEPTDNPLIVRSNRSVELGAKQRTKLGQLYPDFKERLPRLNLELDAQHRVVRAFCTLYNGDAWTPLESLPTARALLTEAAFRGKTFAEVQRTLPEQLGQRMNADIQPQVDADPLMSYEGTGFLPTEDLAYPLGTNAWLYGGILGDRIERAYGRGGVVRSISLNGGNIGGYRYKVGEREAALTKDTPEKRAIDAFVGRPATNANMRELHAAMERALRAEFEDELMRIAERTLYTDSSLAGYSLEGRVQGWSNTDYEKVQALGRHQDKCYLKIEGGKLTGYRFGTADTEVPLTKDTPQKRALDAYLNRDFGNAQLRTFDAAAVPALKAELLPD